MGANGTERNPARRAFVVLRHFSLFSPSLDSPLFFLQDKMVTCQLWRQLRSFVRTNAIIDPPLIFLEITFIDPKL